MWIFQTCPDQYGHCIRQYLLFILTLSIFVLCIFSIIKTYTKQHHYPFQLIPLVVNGAATLLMLCASTQFQSQNMFLTMMVIEIYSYSLLTYSYFGLYLLGTKKVSKKQFIKFRIGFIIFSIVCFLTVVSLLVLNFTGTIKCNQNHGIGNLVLSSLQVPLYIVTVIYVSKTKKYIKNQQQINHRNTNGYVSQIKLLKDQDEYIKIRYRQANTMLISFTLSIIVHFLTLAMFFNEATSCSGNNDIIIAETPYEIIMLCLFDFVGLVPHIAIPIILYVIPSKNSRKGDIIDIRPILIKKQSSDYYSQSQFDSDQTVKNLTIQQQSPKQQLIRHHLY